MMVLGSNPALSPSNKPSENDAIMLHEKVHKDKRP